MQRAEIAPELHPLRQELLGQDHEGGDGGDVERLGKDQDRLRRKGKYQDSK